MKKNRREFLKITGLAGAGLAGLNFMNGCTPNSQNRTGEGRNWQEDPEWQRIQYGEWGGPGVDPRPGAMDEILLKDYAPKSSLVLPVTDVDQPRFPAIDVHIHNYPARADGDTRQVLAEWVETMDEVGVEISVVHTNAIGDRFRELAELYLDNYPDRFQLYCGVDLNEIGASDYPERAAEELRRCYEMGARGVGELTDKGLGLSADSSIPRDERLHHDDPRLDLFWQTCSELNLPVNIHIADHPSAWEPLDVFQERTPDYQHFNLHGDDILSHGELLARRDSLLERHPNTTFIACHLSNEGHDLASLSEALERYPNLYLDISARDYEVGRTPRAAKRFLEAYPDRVLFGTDMGMQKSMYRAWWRLLETDDEYMTGRVWWPYYGLDLPDSVLEPLYRGNAERIMNWEEV
ncbi:MAG: amidohydrolase family protein [Balneolaceae bacterium]|nr:amidohydrolase family protein [Balneolaceae bacterium]